MLLHIVQNPPTQHSKETVVQMQHHVLIIEKKQHLNEGLQVRVVATEGGKGGGVLAHTTK